MPNFIVNVLKRLYEDGTASVKTSEKLSNQYSMSIDFIHDVSSILNRQLHIMLRKTYYYLAWDDLTLKPYSVSLKQKKSPLCH